MKSILNDFLHLFFPNLCLVCETPLVREEKTICLNCICRLPHTNYYKEKENPVYQLFIGKADITEANAFLYFEKGNSVQKLIHQLKYYGNQEIGYNLGKMAAREWDKRGLFNEIDMIIPVPLHPRKKNKRGYNQAECIANGIHSVRKIPVETGVLSRSYFTSSQVKKNLYERWLNMNDIFILENPGCIRQKHLLLVDDVVTSGSTLAACAKALLRVSGVKVSIFTIAAAH